MFYRVLADLVALAHFVFIAFVLFGGLLTLRWRWAPWVHLPAVAWGAAVELFGFFCPLTPLENSLRRASGSAGYSGGFMEQYLLPLIYPDEITGEIQMLLGAVLVVLNGVIYFVIWRRFRTRKVR
ncbi:MAG: DUF2784 domain-containing protein [Candidatus Thiodiazotropha sp. (ex Dulcina madagascariensis)]|nr:DUF2784 domain-containing protein [Candidatus Thiodiazotropha sp. (ex Dulcina madagascariensis)]